MLKKILVGLVIVIVVGAVAMFNLLKSTEKAMANLTISDVNLTTVANGKYVGEYDAKAVYARVQVTVLDHAIKAIDILEHRNGRGAAGERVASNIIAKQSLSVDMISGATASSKVITKAVEVALGGGCEVISKLSFNRVLWLLDAVLALAAATIGVIQPTIYDRVISQEIMAGTLSQDVISIVAAIILFACAARAREEDIIKQIISLGLLGYLFYAYGIYVIERVYNLLYFLYMAIFAISFYSIIYGVASIRREILPQVNLSNLVRRVSVGFSLFIPFMFTMLWTSHLIPLLQTGRKIDNLYSIYIIDLCFIMPAFVILGIMTAKKDGLGLVLTPAMFILGSTLLFPVGLGEFFKPIYGLAIDGAGVRLYLGLSTLFLIVGIIHLRSLRINKGNAFMG